MLRHLDLTAMAPQENAIAVPTAMAATRTSLLALAAMAVVISTASAAIYNVGEPGGAWDLGTNYDAWASSRNFHTDDQIMFKYSPQAHNLLQVSKADYDSCNTASPLATYTSGNVIVTLSNNNTRYFICGFPGHCAGGMKVKIIVTSTSPAPASGPSASNAPPATPASAATNVKVTGFGLAVLLAVAGLMA